MKSVRVAVVELILLSIFTCVAGEVRCREAEREALLDFKLSFTSDPDASLSTWSAKNPDCCTQWNGVSCDGDTGHVDEIDISESSLESHRLRPSLLVLQYLTVLDLRGNNFTMRIPEFISSLTNLEYLGLSHSGFYGKIPPHFGNLTHLQTLSLYGPPGLLYSDNLQWLPRLSSLQSLYLDGVNLSTSTDSVSSLKRLPSMLEFSCSYCSFPLIPHPTCPSNHSTSLQSLDLSFSQISFPGFSCLFNGANNLTSLNLASMEINPDDFLTPLFELSEFILNHLPTSLQNLDLSSNSLNGVISDSHFSKLSNLQSLDLSGNNLLIFKFSHTWVPPFNLTDLSLSSCNVGPHFPKWILTQKDLVDLDISNSSILGVIPNAFWDEISNLQNLNLSHNKFQGTLPNLSMSFAENSYIDLSFNDFHGPIIPDFLFSATSLDLSYNNFSSFSMSYHKLPNKGLSEINLSNNLLSGSIPSWIFYCNTLEILNLANNKLSGDIPSSIASSTELNALHVNNNRLSGELPSSMKNCTQLLILELGYNNFSGSMPFWIGESLSQLIVLSIRSNSFTGELPLNLCNLQRLQVLDLSGNRLSGSIPGCVYNFTSMTLYRGFPTVHLGDSSVIAYPEGVDFESVMWKGILANESAGMLPQLNIIDLSNNCLTGKIPSGFTSLKYLKSLDLSSNNLNGSIPDRIGQLKYMEVLKLSSNRLGGDIPQSLAGLTFLNTLNLSSNNLSGEIPKSTQLQSLDPSSYGGNPELCGEPLPTLCPWDKPPLARDHTEEEEEKGDEITFDFEAFYAALGAGLASGVFGVLVILHFHAPSRHAFFHMAGEFGDWIFVWTLLYKSRIKRRFCFSKEKEAANL